MITRSKINSYEQNEIVTLCSNCNTDTFHIVIASVERIRSDDNEDYVEEESYQLLQCQGCKIGSYQKQINKNNELIEVVDQYPKHHWLRHELKDTYFIPESISSLHEEIRSAFLNENFTLVGIGVRVIIEAICLEQNAEGKNLVGKIESLVDREIITKKLAEALHRLRFMGNGSAHEQMEYKDWELNYALDIVETIIQTIYVVPSSTRILPLPQETRKKST